ncbi:MAG: hypothetical protein J6X40_01965, partial [Bacteroidales bacterium]|nr:hypothetical protein [Bacteroidales bacterium]
TKLAALLLAGVALFATGCTDYEVDIQKVDKKVDNLTTEVNNKIASLEQQIAGINATIATLETVANHDKDIKAVRDEMAALKTALETEFNGKIDKAVADLTAEINKKVNQADYDVDKAAVEKALKDLNDALNAAKDRIKALEDAKFQEQIDAVKTRVKACEDLLAGDWKGKTVKQTIDDLAQAVADLESDLNGKINALEVRVKANEDAIKELKETTLPELEKRVKALEDAKVKMEGDIAALQTGKLDKAVFDQYVEETALTMSAMQKAITALETLTAGFPEGTTIKQYVDGQYAEIMAKFNDYVLVKDFEAFKEIAATKAYVDAVKAELEGRIQVCEDLLAGDWGGKTVQEYIDAKAKDLQGQIDNIVNTLIPELDNRVAALEKSVNEVILPQIEFALDYEGGLQAYIDDAANKAYEDAVAYTDAYMEFLIEQLNAILDDIYKKLDSVLQRVQSIQYVPDYDDLKITTNMSYIFQPVDTEEEIGALVVDQPTKVTYQFLPAEYAKFIANEIQENVIKWQETGLGAYTREELKSMGGYDGLIAYFDVRPVNTRDEDADDEVAPEFIITAVDKVDEATGEITFTVQPVGIASAQYAANGLKPMYDIGLTDGYGYYLRGWDPSAYWEPSGIFRAEDVTDASRTYTVPVWNLTDLKAYQARAAFAAQLRLYRIQGWDYAGDTYPDYRDYGDVYPPIDYDEDGYVDYENELASPYNVLYPNVSAIEILPDPYKKVDEDEIRPFTEDEVYQKLPYSSLREGGVDAEGNPVTPNVGETPEQDPKGYRIILDQAVPALSINGGEPMSIEAAAKAGYLIPEIKTEFVEFTYYDKNFDALAEERQANFVETNKVYAEIEMNPEKSASSRKKEVGDEIVGTYKFTSILGSWPFEGYVTITKPQGKVEADAKIVWTWAYDAIVDHNLFYENEQEQDEDGETPTIYKRVLLPINLNAEQMAELETNLGLTLESFSHLTPNTLKITTTDETGAEVEVTDLEITNVTIDDGNLYADVANFAWNKVYKIVAVYNGLGADNKPLLDADGNEVDFPAEIEVTVALITVDRNREKVVLGPYEHTFVVNGEEFVDGYYHWSSEPLHRDVFEAFDAEDVINVEDVVDFAFDADQDDFNEGELEGKLRMADPSGSAAGYIDFNRNDIVLNTLSTLTPEVLAGELFNSGKRSEENPNLWLGNPVTRNVTTYIGEEVELTVIFNYEVPSYNFLHLRFYTFNPDKEVANLITKLDFDDNDGTVKWWSQVYPSYFTDPAPSQLDRDVRVSNRYALADYDVAYINLAELAFNVVDDKDEIIEDADLEKLGLKAKFIYTDEELGVKPLPTVDQLTDPKFDVYSDLWVGPTVFYYRTNEKKFIPALGELTLTVGEPDKGGYDFPVATRFEFPKASVKVPEEILDYSTFAMVRWTPFQAPEAKDYEIVLDENKIYREPLFKGMTLKDNRPQGTSYYVIKAGEWVVGNATAAATASSTTNGYIKDIVSKDAYHITTEFVYDTTGIPNELKKLLKIEVVEGVPYVVYDYTSEVQFHGVVTIPVTVTLENPWQEDIVFDYNVVIKGIGD